MGVLNLALVQFTGPRVPGFAFLLVVTLLALKVGRGPVLLAGAMGSLLSGRCAGRPLPNGSVAPATAW